MIGENAEEGFRLAIKLSCMGVMRAQPDDRIRSRLRPIYENDADSLTNVSYVIATNFQTVAVTNHTWRSY